jgi:hypothetical protein
MEEEEEIVQPSPQLSEDELAERLAHLVGTTPTAEEKQNVHAFLHNVAVAADTTKTGYLKEEELGMPVLPVRTYKELALFCEDVADMSYFSDYFRRKAEIATSTSLSKDAKLLTLAVLQKREVADITPKEPRKENKGWFRPKSHKYGVPQPQL